MHSMMNPGGRQPGQQKCRWCGNWYRSQEPCLTDEEKRAIEAWRDENGVRWRSKLLSVWETSSAGSVLQGVRNKIGPKGLAKIKLGRRAK